MAEQRDSLWPSDPRFQGIQSYGPVSWHTALSEGSFDRSRMESPSKCDYRPGLPTNKRIGQTSGRNISRTGIPTITNSEPTASKLARAMPK